MADKKSTITPEDRELGADALVRSKRDENPPSWAVDEDIWERAKDAASKTYAEGDDVFWPAVVHIYQQMGGTIQAKKGDEASLCKNLGQSSRDFHATLVKAAADRWGARARVRETYPKTQVAEVVIPKDSGIRVMVVPYDIGDDDSVSFDELVSDVLVKDVKPVAKGMSLVSEQRAYDAVLQDGRYVLSGLDGEAESLRNAVAAHGAQDATVIISEDGSRTLTFRVAKSQGEPIARIVAKVEEERPVAQVLLGTVALRKTADELGILTLCVYEPDVVDGQDEWATLTDIREAAHGYMDRRLVKRNHKEDVREDRVVESWTLDEDQFFGTEFVRKGSWLVRIKMGDKSRDLYKRGEINGVSMGGYCCVAQ